MIKLTAKVTRPLINVTAFDILIERLTYLTAKDARTKSHKYSQYFQSKKTLINI